MRRWTPRQRQARWPRDKAVTPELESGRMCVCLWNMADLLFHSESSRVKESLLGGKSEVFSRREKAAVCRVHASGGKGKGKGLWAGSRVFRDLDKLFLSFLSSSLFPFLPFSFPFPSFSPCPSPHLSPSPIFLSFPLSSDFIFPSHP